MTQAQERLILGSWNVMQRNCLEQCGGESWAVCRGKKNSPEDPMGCPLLQLQDRDTSTSLLWVVRTLCRRMGSLFYLVCCSRKRGQIWLLSKHGPRILRKDLGDFSQQSAVLPELELYFITTDFK